MTNYYAEFAWEEVDPAPIDPARHDVPQPPEKCRNCDNSGNGLLGYCDRCEAIIIKAWDGLIVGQTPDFTAMRKELSNAARN